jgi:3-methyladenine DNA glycosylase Mpg
MNQKKLIDLGIDSINFVASIEVIEAGNLIEAIDFTESIELNTNKKIKTSEKKRRGRPKLTEHQKAFAQFKRAAGKTKKFSVGEEPNRRAAFN